MTATPDRVTRFAPSPTGLLHLGHAHAALFAARLATAGRFLLRIEDIDPVRCRPDYVDAIIEDLAWLGVDWQGPVRVQSRHLSEYRSTLDQLDGQGLLYPCFCTRATIAREVAAAAYAPHGPDGPLYSGTCRRLEPAERADRIAAGAPHALRLDMSKALARLRRPLTYLDLDVGHVACDPAQFGDVVLARKDIPASYHLCVTHDDACQGVTLVTRGADLRAATELHRLLQTLLGWPEPDYAFHPLLTDANGQRLAKRHGAISLRALKKAGQSPAITRAMAGFPDSA